MHVPQSALDEIVQPSNANAATNSVSAALSPTTNRVYAVSSVYGSKNVQMIQRLPIGYQPTPKSARNVIRRLKRMGEHGTQWYNCNRFDEKASVDARDAQAKSRAALERYLHYYNRYANHEQSAKLSSDLLQKTAQKMEALQSTSTLSWIEVQFLRKAVDVLLESRMTLKWTYSFAYYLKRDNMTALFEDNQRDLEVAVESLNELLERPIPGVADGVQAVNGHVGVEESIRELRQQVLDKMGYVKSRREVLLTDTAQGLKEHRWKLNVDFKTGDMLD
ncbi:uncharacterized protein SPPG_03892 [Spizellomyces punctatus DAOM BR117]|uniref:Ariadne domain-containing protein n=1 Tax=Spizellomyces punctatus (strain DAOM BR117) TaxID=645134 RepID=A0A0L0HIX6_SPIPD|nr:uncharacterized protein SPPG_03892 [Spizellomyces punctatus DAOM BR117]KND00779.1 hypothetical protein SPPG_03892 [Spizellomyces punctatus DAOM BR117]|eukprot:XP_016608818.1 hypothetical protein SPPG_03892 [Spizellomyces punctatus DAOM BR117]